MNFKKLLISGAAGALMFGSLAVGAFASANVVVTPTNTQGWYSADTRPGGQINFVEDATSPYPSGALQLLTDNTNTAKAQYLKDVNTPLSSVSNLGYYTKYVSGPVVADPSFQVLVNLNGTSGFTTFVYEPYWNGTVDTTGAWQNWNVNTSGANLWSSRTVNAGGTCSVVSGAGGPPFYSLDWVRSNCPNAVVLSIGVNVGSYNPNYNVEADGVVFNDTTYDFQQALTPSDKNECKDGNWTVFNSPSFKNQGQCVSYVQANVHSGKQQVSF